MEAARSLPTPSAGAPAQPAPSVPMPHLPASAPRQAPTLERRDIDVDLSTTRRERHTSPRAYFIGFLALAVISVAGWLLLGQYIYG